MNISHYSQDLGSIDNAMISILGVKQATKTQKTLCNTRVNSSLIDNETPSCPDCTKEERAMLELKRILS